MIMEHEVHDLINYFIGKHNKNPTAINAGYLAAMAMGDFAGTAYMQQGLFLRTPYAWLPIVMTGSGSEWSIE